MSTRARARSRTPAAPSSSLAAEGTGSLRTADELLASVLVRRYEAGETVRELGEAFGLPWWTVRDRLRDAGARMRPRGRRVHHCELTERGREVIDGLLLGGARVTRAPAGRTHRLTIFYRRELTSWARRVAADLDRMGIEHHVHHIGGKIHLRTFAYAELQPEFVRWGYGTQVPRDIRCTPVVIAYWFAADAHVVVAPAAGGGGGARGVVDFEMYPYRAEDAQRMARLLEAHYGWQPEVIAHGFTPIMRLVRPADLADLVHVVETSGVGPFPAYLRHKLGVILAHARAAPAT